MRDLLDQDRALSPATVRRALTLLGGLLLLTAIIVLMMGIGTLFGDGTFFIGLLQISGGLGILLGLYLFVRLLAEMLITAQRTNDRLEILASALSPRIDGSGDQAKDMSTRKPSKDNTDKTDT